MFAGLPGPIPGKLVLWFLGHGFGESIVGALPDGKWMVVDTCRWDRRTLPRELLDLHGVRRIDLLVVTHPDLDHIGGLPNLVDGLHVGRVWRYPKHADIGDLVAGWLERHRPNDGRLKDLRRALDTLDKLEDGPGRVVRAAYGRDTWPVTPSAYHAHLLAPPDGDLRDLEKELQGLVEAEGNQLVLSKKLMDYLTGQSRRRHRQANALSLAITLEWDDVRVVLGGDVERGKGDRRGWRGVLHHLRQDGRARLVEAAELVKVAHHGSAGAFLAEVWGLHASPEVPLAVVAPFNRGKSPPPHTKALRGVRRRARQLALTSGGKGARAAARRAGWKLHGAQVPARAPCVAVVIGPGGIEEVVASRTSRVYRP